MRGTGFVRAAGIVAVSAVTIWGSAAGSGVASASAGPVELPGTAAGFTSSLTVTGTPSAAQRLTVQVWLRPDTAQAESYATAVSTPGSRPFHRYLSPSAYEKQFGPGREAVESVESWLAGAGFTGVSTDLNGHAESSYVRATAPVSTIDRAFSTTMRLYRSTATVKGTGGAPLEANDRAVSVPASIAGQVLGITGLSNAAPLQTLAYPGKVGTTVKPGAKGEPPSCSAYYGQNTMADLPRQWGETSFPTQACGYTAGQLRSAYGATASMNGKGQTVALIELGLAPDMFQTLQDYAASNSLAAPSAKRYTELPLGPSSCGDPFNVEEQLDVESAYVMAPKASELVVGGDACDTGDDGLQGVFDADLAVIDGNGPAPLATIVSNSWENNAQGESQPPAYTQIEHAYLVQAAAEGVGMYYSAGDSSGVFTPSSDPYAIAVGGTTLGIGSRGQRLFETGWSTGESEVDLSTSRWQLEGEQAASGGGPSQLWAQPAWQAGVVPAAMAKPRAGDLGPVRSVPDLSAVADPFTGFALGLLESGTYEVEDIGGTSLATPVVAGLVADAQQGQPKAFGFLDPVLYSLTGTSALHATRPLTDSSPSLYRGVACYQTVCGGTTTLLATFDDQFKDMSGYTGQVTRRGYDNMTGLGTPNGHAFITGLRNAQ
ncbi:MAG TPA: protease pro-enzyme activation domain-containing protein [Streptosporangiaceae bacterium]|jgi:subtilase family serine protease